MKTLVILVVMFQPIFSVCQEDWTLDRCIDSALIHNLSIQQAQLEISISETRKHGEKYNYLPSFYFNASHGYNWGQTVDPFTNQFATDRVQSNNFSLSSSATIFSGLQNKYKQELADIELQMTMEQLNIAKQNLCLDIMTAFLLANVNTELVRIQEEHLNLAIDLLNRNEILEQLNHEPKRSKLELEALISKEKYKLTMVKNELSLSLHKLQDLIGCGYDSTFSVSDSIALSYELNASVERLYSYQIRKQAYSIKLDQSQLYPRLTLNGFVGTGYSGNSKYLSSNGQFVPKPFGIQVNENFYQSASISLTIPIFNGSESYSRIKIRKLEYQQYLIDYEQQKQKFQSAKLKRNLEIENLKESFQFAESSMVSFEKLYSESVIQFNEGYIDYYSFLQSKHSFFESETELVLAYYKLQFAILMDEFLGNNF